MTILYTQLFPRYLLLLLLPGVERVTAVCKCMEVCCCTPDG